MQIEQCRALVDKEMDSVDKLITERLHSDVALVNQMSAYIVNSGGKRLRPQLVLWAAGACGYQGRHHLDVAAIIEFIHTATLLHDDVVDASELRRGTETANTRWGNEAAVLVGDFLYSRAFEMMVEVGSMQVMQILAATTNRIAEGEVMQLMNVHEPDLTEQEYVAVIRAKTARLFEAATQLAGILANVDKKTELALGAYGRHLGTAFQIADDVLDYVSNNKTLGKLVGDDLAEGKPTLPLILAMRHGNPQQKEVVAHAIREGGRDQIDDVMAVITATGALDRSMETAIAEADFAIEALEQLASGEYRDALASVARYSVHRLS